MPNFSIALSGLEADNTALNTIANNLSNMSTNGYKDKTTSFSDMFYQSMGTSGAGNDIVVGTGTKVAATSTDYSQGSYNTSGMTSSDMAVDGDGFFVVSNGSSQFLTRDGSFTESSTGQLQTASGDNLMGYSVTGGVADTSKLINITLPTKGTILPASASTEVTIKANLDSISAVGATTTSSATLYDTQGDTHTATITYTKNSDNTWGYSVALPASDYTSGVSTPITGTLNFDASGNLSTVTTGGVTYTVGTAVGDITSIPLSFTGLADGASDLSIKWNMLNSSDGQILTQVDSASATSSSVADGYAAGTYESFAVDTDGTVEATYSNGETLPVGQVALADVTNEQGLNDLGSGLYQTTLSSGTANVGMAGTGGLGTVKDDAVEVSNVDISTEFSNLIVTQRAFEANSKSITTFDSVTQTAINLIR
jgi:flagellar hook protein FlgE